MGAAARALTDPSRDSVLVGRHCVLLPLQPCVAYAKGNLKTREAIVKCAQHLDLSSYESSPVFLKTCLSYGNAITFGVHSFISALYSASCGISIDHTYSVFSPPLRRQLGG